MNFLSSCFSPGLGYSRLTYNVIAQSIASSGYIVVTIDHPYDAPIVEYPGGTLVFAANLSDAQNEQIVVTRARDTSFILDQLDTISTVKELSPGARHASNVCNVAMFGHSLGGATSAAALLNDVHIKGGANLDGSFFGPVIQQGLDRPFLIFANERQNQSVDASWAAIWPQLKGWKLELMLKGSTHGTFSDLPLLAKVLGLAEKLPSEVGEIMGTLDGKRALDIIWGSLVAFFDFVLGGKSSRPLHGPEPMYAEVTFVGFR